MLVFLLAGCDNEPLEISQVKEDIGTTLRAENNEDGQDKLVAIKGGLRESLGVAVRANDAYKSMIAMESEAFANIDFANSARKTQVSTNVNLGGLSEAGAIGGSSIGVTGGLSLSRLLHDAGESAATVDRASAQALVAQAERQLRGNELALEAGRAWIDVWQFGSRIALLMDKTTEMDTLVGQIERIASNGMIDRATIESVRRKIVEISLEQMRLEAKLKESQIRFRRYFNESPGVLAYPSEVVSLEQAHRMARDWKQAPVLRRQAAELVMARYNVTVAEAAFKPRARIEGSIRSPMQNDESTVTTLGVLVTYTFGDGGRRVASLRSAKSRLEAAQAQLAEAQRRVEAEIVSATTQLKSIESSMPLVAETIRLSASEAEIARSQIVTGQSNLQRLIDAEIENYRARDSEIEIKAEKLTLQLTIAALTGGLGIELGLE
jgi:outer membrane protein, adhesin transport system